MAESAARRPTNRGATPPAWQPPAPSANDGCDSRPSAALIRRLRRRRLRVRRLGIGLLLGLLGVVLVGAVARRLLGLALALGRAVVRVVEAGPLEVHRDGVEHARDGRLA